MARIATLLCLWLFAHTAFADYTPGHGGGSRLSPKEMEKRLHAWIAELEKDLNSDNPEAAVKLVAGIAPDNYGDYHYDPFFAALKHQADLVLLKDRDWRSNNINAPIERRRVAAVLQSLALNARLAVDYIMSTPAPNEFTSDRRMTFTRLPRGLAIAQWDGGDLHAQDPNLRKAIANLVYVAGEGVDFRQQIFDMATRFYPTNNDLINDGFRDGIALLMSRNMDPFTGAGFDTPVSRTAIARGALTRDQRLFVIAETATDGRVNQHGTHIILRSIGIWAAQHVPAPRYDGNELAADYFNDLVRWGQRYGTLYGLACMPQLKILTGNGSISDVASAVGEGVGEGLGAVFDVAKAIAARKGLGAEAEELTTLASTVKGTLKDSVVTFIETYPIQMTIGYIVDRFNSEWADHLRILTDARSLHFDRFMYKAAVVSLLITLARRDARWIPESKKHAPFHPEDLGSYYWSLADTQLDSESLHNAGMVYGAVMAMSAAFDDAFAFWTTNLN